MIHLHCYDDIDETWRRINLLSIPEMLFVVSSYIYY